MNTVSFISIPGSIAPDQEILVFGDRRLNYAHLNDLVGRLSSAYKTLGLKPRDVVHALHDGFPYARPRLLVETSSTR